VKKIEVYQSLWGMTDLPSIEMPWNIMEQIRHIKQAGFDGALQFVDDFFEETLEISKAIIDSGLKLGISCVGYEIEDIASKIAYAKRAKAEFINIMVKHYFIVGQEAIMLLNEIIKQSIEMNFKVLIETHRGTITQDLIRTSEYIEAIPEMLLTLDLSHYIVSGEIGTPDRNVENYFEKLLQRAASIHIRVGNGEQIQVPLNALDEIQYNNFIRWWKNGIEQSILREEIMQPFPVVIELGPCPYQQKVMSPDGSWIIDCNRWDEAIRWKQIVEKF